MIVFLSIRFTAPQSDAGLNFIPPLMSARKKQVAPKIFAYALVIEKSQN